MDLPKIQTLMRRAKQASQKSTFHTMIGAVIVSNGKVISTGWNQEKTHPFVKLNGQYKTADGWHIAKNIHAEVAAVFKIKNKESLEGATIIVYRQGKNGDMLNSRPCPMCEKVLRQYGFKKMIFTVDGGVQEEFLLD